MRARTSISVAVVMLGLVTATQAVVIIEHSDGSASAYHHDTVERSWPDAEANASTSFFRGVSGQLVAIANLDEQRFVQQVGTGDRWIGMTDLESFGASEGGDQGQAPLPIGYASPTAGQKGAGWIWTNGDPVNYQNWGNNEPNDAGGNEDAAHLRSNGQWNDDLITDTKASIVEFELDALPQDVFKVTAVKHYNGVTNLAIADAVIAGFIPSVETTGQIGLFDLLDSGDPGFVPVNQPVPGVSDDDHFVLTASAPLDVQSAGVFTFALITDDGGRLTLDGEVIAEFFGSRPFGSTVSVPVELTAGSHELEVVWFENTGGSGIEIGYASGSEGSLNTNFTVLGDPSLGIALGGAIETTTYDVQLETLFGLAFGQGFNAVEAADHLIAGSTPGAKGSYYADVVNFNDLEESSAGDLFGQDDPFIGLMETDADRFVIQASGFVEILQPGFYTFGLNFDDGARLRIDGVDLINQASPGTTLASLFLNRGFHHVDVTMGDDGGHGAIEFFAAAGQFSDFDAQVFRLVGDTAKGGLRVTQNPLQVAVPEPATGALLFMACLAVRRRTMGRS